MLEKFNTYINDIDVDYWKNLCEKEGELRLYRKGEKFAEVGEVCQYIGYVKSGTLKYVAYSSDNTEHEPGLEFSGEFVADYLFSMYGQKSLVAIVAVEDSEINCISIDKLNSLAEKNDKIRSIIMHSTEALFATVYSRYLDQHTKSPQERYNDLISKHSDIFELFSLKDIASYLNVTPTHLSRLRKNI